MLADVPVGAFLSGGTDSSLVVACMQQATSQRVKTFSIGFTETEFNEAPFARAVAQHLGTDHTEYTLTPRDCLDVIPSLPQIYDEPFADPSQMPTYLVCKLARRRVTVALSGDGGDELFGGYSRYQTALSQWQKVQRLPAVVRASAAAVVQRLPLDGLADRLQNHSWRWRASTLRDFYRTGLYRWQARTQSVLGTSGDAPSRDDAVRPRYADDLKQMMHFDTCEYLPDDILVKVDRAAMAVSLETRVPLLDVEVARAAWRIPTAVLLKDGRGKWVLRELLRRRVPAEIVDRPKKGFAVPLTQWLRAELRPWAAELLDADRLRQEGYLDAAMIQRRWHQHLNGRTNWAPELWNALAFQAWLEHWRRDCGHRRATIPAGLAVT
jgi:asparagine synthase (glutamine-hydrolysing)